MTFFRRMGIIGLASAALLVGDLVGDQSIVSMPRFVSDAVAVVGRPLTPVSVAGVARRTTRRCAAGAYDC
ncbi:hypothetical protein ACCS54_03680 [Rhizobium johnstonii]|uniref:Uncharacterized protein n=1 Tax=Rhizobium leguminosarum bv. viciae TaxID=387 RepID=A0A8G2IRN0_RHILV|nr:MULTISPECIES: hypothetical protein [Rhizobium]MBB4506577.1 hypothetical protein [Rhizobium leguminosarum]MBY5320886.1 hypothetical protein [Rhizobium leguminosarum]MBY5341405.1 hypothetical protein [Rhizobium leguminosarum]MBY5378908.1 hypothetical protein [Rhizobium leguminosarum]MBY5380139.1 hypothetical protein [Rhizobium leguminosarum]